MTELIIDTGAARVRLQYDFLIRQFLSMANTNESNDYIRIEGDYLEIREGTATLGEDNIIRCKRRDGEPIRIPIYPKAQHINIVLEGDDFDSFARFIDVDVTFHYSTIHKMNYRKEVPPRAVKNLCNKLKDLQYETYVIFEEKLVSAYAQYKTKIEVKRGN